MENTSLREKLERNIYAGVYEDLLTNDDLCSIIELILILLNATDVQSYANERGKSYNGVKKHDPNYKNINGFKFCINNSV
jgi:hypothetical protein